MKRTPVDFLKDIAVGLIISLVYFLSAKFGLTLAFNNPSATPVWPPTGIAIATLLVLGYRFWPSIFIGAFAANYLTSSPLSALGIAFGNTLEGFLGAYLINNLASGKKVFDRYDSIFKFAGICIFVTMVSATIGVTSLVAFGFETLQNYLQTWITWWMGDMVGALIFTPLLVLWARDQKLRNPEELVWLHFIALIMAIAIFGGILPDPFNTYPTAFLITPLYIWAAFRFSQKETITLLIIVSGIAIWGTLNGKGQFAVGTPNISLIILQVYMAFQVVTMLILSALVQQTRNIEKKGKKK